MTGAEQVQAYAQADFREPNELFSSWVLERTPDAPAACVDLGCGPGDVVRRLAAARSHWTFEPSAAGRWTRRHTAARRIRHACTGTDPT